MRKSRRTQFNRGALELIEEATHLLRSAPASLLAVYAMGTLPFVLGLLFFTADMASHPQARDHAVAAALGMTGLFLWMKFWQALFARRARALVTGVPAAPLDWRRCGRILAAQVAFQPFGLILIPLAAVLTVPFAWVYSCFQNLTVLADGESGDLRRLFQRAWKQAALWPTENQALKFTLFGFTGFVFLNWMILGLAAPILLKKFLGLETAFSRNPWAMLNTTFFGAIGAVTYLSVDPILKLVHVLRCFYGEALADGADLKAELRRTAREKSPALATLLALGMFLGGISAPAQETAPAPAATEVVTTAPGATTDLDAAIREVVAQRKYTWRMPRETAEADSQPQAPGMFRKFLDQAVKLLGRAVMAVVRLIDRVMRSLFGGWKFQPITPDTGFSWMAFQRLMLYLLGLAVIIAGLYLAYRLWRARRAREDQVVDAAPLPAVPDLTQEDVAADQLPEDGWTRLARELWERGEFRLALRAFYLASLAHLAGRNLITLARAKSNHEYELELRRRSHALAELLPPFTENLRDFERVWYGTHPAGNETVARFAANVDRLKTGA